MKTRKALRVALTRHVHSESRKTDTDSSSEVNEDSQSTIYRIEYPIEGGNCQLCQDRLPNLNLKIREHINDVHGILNIKYKCSNCDKEYDTISSIKSHYPACKRKLTNTNNLATNLTNPALTTNTTSQSNTINQNVINIPPLQCLECFKNTVSYTAKDQKGLITHMRTKHSKAYEESKKVASIRIAWNNDEDKILANLEVSLKSIQKGQILDRLFIEWNKLVVQSRANFRSKEAIRGRRQQPEYKAILADLQSTLNNNNNDQATNRLSSDSSLSSESESDSSLDTATPHNDVSAIENFLCDIVQAGHIQLSNHMKNAINAFLSPNGTIDPIQQTMLGIHQSLSIIRNNSKTNSSRTNRAPTSNIRKPARNKSRIEKAKQHAYYQKLYMNNKSRLMDELIDGVVSQAEPPPIHIAVKHYENIWSTLVQDTHPVVPKPDIDVDNNILLSPITKNDIIWAIKRTKRDSAKGPDRVTVHEAKLLSEGDLYIAFNIWLGCRKIPPELKINRTTLIPKGNQGLDKITNWRPITISSILLRLFNKIIGYRMFKYFEIDKRQLGFRPINGCSMNILWLHHLLKHARLNKRDLYVCLIDVAKAFDSVPHESIFRALIRHKAPPSFIELVRDQYADSYTSIAYKDLSSKKIKILRGVKQGDSLSPLLFNLVIDELFGILKDQFGYCINNVGSSNIKCFADDMCLVSGSRIGMGHLIKEAVTFLEDRGLKVNPTKCMSIGLAKGFKGKKSKIIVEPIFNINDTSVPILGHIDNYTKYLGIQFTSVGAINGYVIKPQLEVILNKLQKIPLKPQQKIDLIRSYIIPRFIYQLINVENYPTLLKQIDILIRRTIRSILHLPMGLSIEFFYLPVRDGGLQIPVLSDIIGLAKVRIYKQIMRSDDALLKHLVETQGFDIIHRFTNGLKLDSSFETTDLKQRKVQMMRDRRVSFANKVHGHGSEVFSTCPLTNFWLYGDCKTVSGRTYINGIKLRTNTLESKVTLTRGLLVDKLCRRCKKQDESLMHISQYCITTKGLRYKRHNLICERVMKKLKERGFEVFREKAFTTDITGLPILRPDIVAVKARLALVLDIQCVYETSGASFINAYDLKVQKYSPLIQAIKDRHQCDDVKVHALVIGSRGSFHYGHLSIWYNLGFTSSELKYLSLNCLESSLRIFTIFHKSLQSNGIDSFNNS